MAETYTFHGSRIVKQRWLCIIWDAGAARSGEPTVDPSKFSISASGGSVGTTLTATLSPVAHLKTSDASSVGDGRPTHRCVRNSDPQHDHNRAAPVSGSFLKHIGVTQ
jgi:hypothetical protein